MKLNPHIQNILDNSKKDREWEKEAEERKSVRQESRKSGMIATQLAYFMKTNGISQTDLGKLVGVSPQQISKILKGRENLTLGTIEKIESALKIELIKAVDLEAAQNRTGTVLQSPKSSSKMLDLGTASFKVAIEKTRFYGGTMSNPPLPAFANSYYEEMKQKAIKRAHERFEMLSSPREFHFESEECLAPIVTVGNKSRQLKKVWVESEGFISEEI
ncbi:helix-turn-helix domain-containing protein [Algoriphagus persicinus]|uniref:helix-turn-helix domain-containing protein n=1 Tax=Algoriphagus persicinus TaxID=3108754 RepID=UPI002B3F1190|nr:helix-turn-helix transcriptional regulator [Algoriphagus sp. E1-3-M2]MEB2787287.1 helix-turn-helix transcriptional regulator [Algoriphagus sp. E1-3-M2]